MNALVILMDVIRSVRTQKDHLRVVVGVASLYWTMERLVWKSMSVRWVHIIASSSVSMKMVDSDVSVLLATLSMLIKEPVQVHKMLFMSRLYHLNGSK